jgi:NAD-dependent dihydropyrimidine dehydrogenase PreA subunit
VLSWPSDKLSPNGYLLPAIVAMDRCNVCQVCGWMCPDHAIDVYSYVETAAKAAKAS